jgi:thioredoxin-related protein
MQWVSGRQNIENEIIAHLKTMEADYTAMVNTEEVSLCSKVEVDLVKANELQSIITERFSAMEKTVR